LKTNRGENIFHLYDIDVPLRLHVPGQHLVQDATAAIALIESIFTSHSSRQFGHEQWNTISNALATFRGSKRRSEVLGEFRGVLFIDDYGHHPTAIKATLDGIKKFWPQRRIIIDFMSHTYTRTIALLDEFVASLDLADSVVLHKIYTSAREQPIPGFNGKVLYNLVQERRPDLQAIDLEELASDSDSGFGEQNFVAYSDDPVDAFNFLVRALHEGDIFITMGAGDNWKLGKALTEHFERTSSAIVDEAKGRQS
jgi:UDP-N-acetylmuramate--alanine ligase